MIGDDTISPLPSADDSMSDDTDPELSNNVALNSDANANEIEEEEEDNAVGIQEEVDSGDVSDNEIQEDGRNILFPFRVTPLI